MYRINNYPYMYILKKVENDLRVNPINVRLHSIIKENTGGYEKQRILKFNPINGAKIEIMKFNTQMKSDTKLPCKYEILGNFNSGKKLDAFQNFKCPFWGYNPLLYPHE